MKTRFTFFMFLTLFWWQTLSAQNIKSEAEFGQLSGVFASSAIGGYSGSGYVEGFDNPADQVAFTVNASAQLYDLYIRYASPYGQKGFDLIVNGEASQGTFNNTGAAFASVYAGKVLLAAGNNSIIIRNGWGYYSIDFIELAPSFVSPPLKPSTQLVDGAATPATQSLFSYMVSLYGSKVLSGQQDEVPYIYTNTGREPAIGCYDLMDYSPSRIQFGANPAGQTEAHINWAKGGNGRGMISLVWHWNAPADLINQEPDKLWWRGFYTDATTFDVEAALADRNGYKFSLILRDIDAIAAELKKYRDADVPVLWRPLHEAPGGWFWWGAKGATAFKDLWAVMFDRLKNYHGLHNLIWVYTGTSDMNWYPGDSFVDVVSLDLYQDASSSMSQDWSAIQSHFNGRKIVALSESGNLPDLAKVRAFGTWWSWFAVWGGSYIWGQPLGKLQGVFGDGDVITRDELPDWRTFSQATRPAPGLYNIVAQHSQKAMDVYGWSMENGGNIAQWDSWGGLPQQFRVEDTGDGYFRIVSNLSNKCLDVWNFSLDNGANIQQYDCHNTDNQKWSISLVGDGYYKIIGKQSNKAVDVEAFSTANGANISQYTYNGTPNQLWRLVPVTNARQAAVTATTGQHETAAVQAFPNPVSDVLTVTLPDTGHEAVIEFVSPDGRVVHSLASGEKTVSISTRGFATGLYLLKVRLANTRVVRKIMVK